MSDEIIIHTDGGCSGNPGPGGWAIVVEADGVKKQLSGGDAMTTNNKMELTAAINALSVVKNTPSFAGRKVIVHIDSQYVKNGITVWIKGWKAKGWKTADKKPVKNQELWGVLDELNSSLDVDWVWVKGHAGEEDNELCDSLCQMEIKKFQK
ncbi:MAG: ribonuclease HI [Treponema sp.]|nr:ribonuclease HI [Treponema sp.]